MKSKANLAQALATTQAARAAAQADERPSRTGKKIIAGFFDPAVSKQLRRFALENDTSVQALVAEALNLLFEKHGLSPIA